MPRKGSSLSYKLNDETREIVENNLKLVTKVISDRFTVYAEYYEDMVQEGRIGLIKAACRHDKTRGSQFSTFAYMCIKNEIQRFVSECTDQIKVPVSVRLAMNALKSSKSDEEVEDKQEREAILKHYQVSQTLIECGKTASSCFSINAKNEDGKSYLDYISDTVCNGYEYNFREELESLSDFHGWLNFQFPESLLENRIFMDYIRDSQSSTFLVTQFTAYCSELYGVNTAFVRNILKEYPKRSENYFRKLEKLQ